MNWVAWCAYAGMTVALPTALWRLPLAMGATLGTPDAWRQEQEIPGAGAWYLLLLSAMQLAAIGCMFFLTIEPRKVTPRWLPPRPGRYVPAVVSGAGSAGALVLALLVAMSIIAWDKVDPFAGTDYNAWAWLCAVCYLLAALWPPLLGAASVGYLHRHRPSSAPEQP
ncbi:hypothetical protein [Pseudonocardia sp. NPDC049635]|uniref:hypothetical protein n=1 Tax=Pseudonocardia sp. NPDC049635 TaxID=3155506 RepID=UPI0033C2BA83